jgi:hypothetical protein
MNDERYARECHQRRAGDTSVKQPKKKQTAEKKSVQFFIRPQGKTNRKNEEDAETPEVLKLITGRRETRRVILAAAFSCFPRSDSVGSTASKSANESE